MKIIANSKVLKDAVGAAAMLCGGNIVPALNCIYILATGGVVKLISTNLGVWISVICDAEIVEEGSCLVPAKKFLSILSHLPEQPIVMIGSENNGFAAVDVEFEKGKYSFSSILTSEFPRIPNFPFSPYFSSWVDFKEFQLVSKDVATYASNDELRPALTCVNLKVDKTLTFVATNGHILTKQLLKSDGNAPMMTFSALLNAKRLLAAISMMAKFKPNKVQITSNDHYTELGASNVTILIKKTEEKYPDYQNAFPDLDGARIVSFVNKDLIRSVLLAKIATNYITNDIVINFGQDKEGNQFVTIESISFNEDASSVTVDCEFSDNVWPFFGKLAFNANYLLKCLKSIKTERVFMNIKSGRVGVLIHDEDNNGSQILIMPIQL